MLYAMDSFLFPEVFQSWCASMRDQAAVQLIASTALQHQMQNDLAHAVEAGADLLEEELELPYQPPVRPARPARATRGHTTRSSRASHMAVR